MRVEAVKWQDGWLMLKASDTEARRFAYKFPGEGEYELREKKPLRSLDANSYLWVLCDKIAKAVDSTKEEIYRNAIRDVGVFRDFHMMDIKEAQSMRTAWEMIGTGWVTEQVDFEQDGEHVVIRAYYGSSRYNRKQFSRLLDSIIQDAKAVGVETMPPDELNAMMSQWEAMHENKKQ